MSVYSYHCKECGSVASKVPVEPHKPGEIGLAGLGTWRCPNYKTKVKVGRSKNTPK